MLNQIDVQDIVKIAREAGLAVLKIYNQDFDVEYKKDNSPLTIADKNANDIIVNSPFFLTNSLVPSRGSINQKYSQFFLSS